jgi:hypothetical protein
MALALMLSLGDKVTSSDFTALYQMFVTEDKRLWIMKAMLAIIAPYQL